MATRKGVFRMDIRPSSSESRASGRPGRKPLKCLWRAARHGGRGETHGRPLPVTRKNLPPGVPARIESPA